ncbi:MAG: alpha/beta hydrolase-fold protein [Candidatus Eremiobacteraeota bacterium]|nr:alpha/beta hydrolase-fold protein [Candidatus Eremiobacteraeota bacterium]
MSMIDTLRIKSAILDNERDIFVLLPPGYHEEKASYPVFYMHDGQNIFSTHGNWFKKWNIDHEMEKLYRDGAANKMIIVGVTHLNKREYEFTPTFDALVNSGGGSLHYLRFLAEELKPLIEDRYRVKGDREHTAIGGSSLGGIITLQAAISSSDVFSRFAVVSPSMWWDFGVMLEKVRAWTPRPGTIKLWVDIGMKEGPGSLLLDDILKEIYNPVNFCRVLCNLLLSKGFKLKKTLMYTEDPEGLHDEHAWGRRFPDMVKFFFPLAHESAAQGAMKKAREVVADK